MAIKTSISSSTTSLGEAIFGTAELGDQRRTKRLVQTFDRMQKHPGGTLPDKLSDPPGLRAFYRLCDRDEVTHAALIAAARKHTLGQVAAYDGDVLMIQDATELDYTSRTSMSDDLGQIGMGYQRGYICQNVLAVAADTGEVLGLADQILHHRVETPEKESLAEHRNRDTRESLLWPRATKHLPADRQLIDVSDRASDTFEYLEHEYHSGRRFVLRAYKRRKVYAGHKPIGEKLFIKDCAQTLPELGRFTMDVQSQEGKHRRKARIDAEFIVRGGPVLVCPPHAKKGIHGDDPLKLWVMLVTEVDPPTGEKPVSWMLLTNEPVRSYAAAWKIIGWYEKRWIIEELHKAKKTGVRIEDLQFTTIDRLEPAIALLSVVAVTLLNLRDASRRPDAETRLATTLLSEDYVIVLSLWRHRERRTDLSVHEFYMALARLGGHQNRKSDSQPGWIVLWRGWTKLQHLLVGYDAAQSMKCGKT